MIEQEAQKLFEDGDNQTVRDMITDNVEQQLLNSLQLSMDLTDEVEAETRERFGIREPEGRSPAG